MTNVGILVSGGGTNLQAIINSKAAGGLELCNLSVVVSSRPGARALGRAEKAGIPTVCVERKAFSEIVRYDDKLIEVFESYGVDLIVMAGFLSLVGRKFADRYEGRMINVHPSLIPAFSGNGCYGLKPHQMALEYGVKVTGATVHFVEYVTDSGPIIMQGAVDVLDGDTPELLQRRVMEQVEWKLLPEAIRLFSEGRLRLDGRKVTITQ